MKKLLLSVFALASSLSINAQCTELFISEYVDGSGNDKALEIYNPTPNTINLSGYSIHRYSNGNTSSTGGGVLNLTGTISSGQAFVITNGQTTGTTSSPACSPALQALAHQLDGAYPAPTYMNGNDAITLEKGGVKVDIFGKIGEDPGASWTDVFPYTAGAGAWWTKDHTLRRKPTVTMGVTTNPTVFNVTTQWDSLPENTWTGLRTHSCSCPVAGVNDIDNSVSVVVYPNPSAAGYFNISTTEMIETVQVFNVIGQEVIRANGNSSEKSMTIATSALPKGVYVVKVMFDKNRTTVVKLSVQ